MLVPNVQIRDTSREIMRTRQTRVVLVLGPLLRHFDAETGPSLDGFAAAMVSDGAAWKQMLDVSNLVTMHDSLVVQADMK
jgi:hypothetical protein